LRHYYNKHVVELGDSVPVFAVSISWALTLPPFLWTCHQCA